MDELPQALESTPKIVSQTIDATDWSDLFGQDDLFQPGVDEQERPVHLGAPSSRTVGSSRVRAMKLTVASGTARTGGAGGTSVSHHSLTLVRGRLSPPRPTPC
jgi:hypothetical protein